MARAKSESSDISEFIEQEVAKPATKAELKPKRIETDIEVEVTKTFRNLIGERMFYGKIGEKITIPVYAYDVLKRAGKVIKA